MESGTVLQQKRVGIVSSEPIRLAGLLSVLEVHPTAMPVAGDLDTMLRDGELHFLILDLTEHAQWLETLTMVRRTRPDAPRPYRAVGYPVLPAIYIVLALFIDVVLLRYKPQFTWPGLIVVLLGIPVYYAWSRSAAAKRASA